MLMDKTSGKLEDPIKNTIIKEFEKQHNTTLGKNISTLFVSLVETRNRIIHSFAITDKSEGQILQTKEKKTHKQFPITTDLLMKFIKDNDRLSSLLHEFRGN
uniref:selenium binding protein n=2 Tax=Streptococcaceae TaxID=1300 RepID=UPI000C7ACCE5